MFKPFSWLAVTLALALAGCASAPPMSNLPAQPADAPIASGPRAAPRAPVLPSGPLTEIAVKPGTPAQEVATLAATTDLWERIRRGFAMPDLDTDLVRDREQWYVSRPDYIQRMTERSSKYLFHIVEELERRNMPSELALLPFIESAFNPNAVSSARAAGMWQFMPATGESFDLKQNMFRDDRRDVLASTRAALDYLQQLYTRFGDWHLALAAYNWGQGNVNRAITRNQREGKPTTYLDLNMPTETRYYVPKLQAVKNIVANPARFSAVVPPIGNHPFFDSVPIERDIDVAMVARLAQIDEADFRALNPSMNKPVIMSAGTPHVLLPWDNATVFQTNLRAHKGPLASWTAWTAPTTMSPALAAERLGMGEAELRRINNIPPRMLVRQGATLLVHRNGRLDADVPEHVADNAQLLLQPEVVLKRTMVQARKGDNVTALAKRYGVNAGSVAEWNHISINTPLKKGQSLALMLPQRQATAVSAKAKAPAKTAAAKTGTAKTAVASRKKAPVKVAGNKAATTR
ncbi:transglycosylase SLT domain-containing protein [Hydrogenophaga sp. OTU3427]|uniref:transglycosylase SLT domain-containing protein n=1 Tax=Hydrogenophaga sp. OTU3427 TaxID=3043856 RepID=UPI00313DCAA2